MTEKQLPLFFFSTTWQYHILDPPFWFFVSINNFDFMYERDSEFVCVILYLFGSNLQFSENNKNYVFIEGVINIKPQQFSVKSLDI